MKRFERFVWPLTAGNWNSPIGRAVNPPRFCDTLTGATPGVSSSSLVKFRPFSGRSTTCFSVTADPSSAEEACSCAPDASTVTVSVTAPTSRAKSNVAVWLTTRENGFTTAVWKPLDAQESVYRPGCRFENRYTPALLDPACCSTPVSTLEIETSAPGITAPVASRTVPLTVAVEICASAEGAPLSSKAAASATKGTN